MSKFKRLAGLAAGAILLTGVFTSTAAPASATNDHASSVRVAFLDTGWGG